MKTYVTDTHALYWYLTSSPRLGPQTRVAFQEGEDGEATILISAMVMAELYYLNEKHGRPMNFIEKFENLLDCGQFQFEPFNPEDVLDFDTDGAVPEMHDRIIVGVARRLGVPASQRIPRLFPVGLFRLSGRWCARRWIVITNSILLKHGQSPAS